tara:strand:- start:6016 stop:6234 length:219 start_codon:yes stop_codon:yes gene_type:complete
MVGVNLTEEDLKAIKKLYAIRWSADIRNWNERNVEGCLWKVTIPDLSGNWISETGSSLSKTIYKLLERIEVE